LPFGHAVKKVSDGNSGLSRVETTDWDWIPAERLHPKDAY
jgi:hypothetical protein